jgi:hypothetical protein
MIGILGGYGKVGLQAARVLKGWGNPSLRIGGRNPEKVQNKIINEFPDAEWVKVDIENDDSLKNFITDCELIVNCAGPSHRITARAAQMCLSYGCHHIDAGEGKNIERMHKSSQRTAAFYGAGAIPGLSGLLPRWLANSFDNVKNLIAYTGGLDQFTLSGAEDYLFGVFDEAKEPLAAWKNGACCSSSLNRRSGVALPFFPHEVNLQPYFDTETEFVAKSLSLRNGEWYLAVDGEHTSAALEGISAQFHADAKAAIKHLCLATELDAAGRQTYLNYLVQLEGVKQGKSLTRTLVLQTMGTSVLTGSVAAVTGIALLEGELPVNVGPIAAIPDPDKVIARLSETRIISRLKVFDCSINDLLQVVEGEI